MKLNKTRLRQACFKVAKTTMWDTRPIDAARIKKLADRFFKIAASYEQDLVEHRRDPNFITRAVAYLDYCHAMPPMKDDTGWFNEMLSVLIELACPNSLPPRRFESFYSQIEEGIKEARSRYSEVK